MDWIDKEYITIYTIPLFVGILYLFYLYFEAKTNKRVISSENYIKALINSYILSFIALYIYKHYSVEISKHATKTFNKTEIFTGNPNF